MGDSFWTQHSTRFSPEYYSRSVSVLESALERVPAYQNWRALDPGAKSPIDCRYSSMPIFTKKDIRANFPEGLIPRGVSIDEGLASGEISFVKTSGTTDESVTNIWNQLWWDESEKASWRLNSFASRTCTGNHREAVLASPLNVGIVSDDFDLPMERRRLSRFLYLNDKSNASYWTPGYMDRMISELQVFQPEVLEANPSLLARLCRYASTAKREVYQPKLIVFTYEFATIFHTRQIRSVFDVPVASSYGSTETGYVFMECEEGKFHQNTESCRVDFQPLKPEHGGPLLGRILVTTLSNPWCYLLRFEVGDLVRIDREGRCRCGRDSGLILSAVEGRTKDLTLTCDGRLVTVKELSDALGVLEGVGEYQLRQVSPKVFVLLLLADGGKDGLAEEAESILLKLYGKEASVEVTCVDSFPPEPSGKHRLSRTDFAIGIDEYVDPSCITLTSGGVV